MNLDRLQFPHLARYIDSLPQQLDSYPAALTKADFSLILRERLAAIFARGQLPLDVRGLLTAPWKSGDWIPTTAYVALCALARDQLWQTDADYQRGMVEVATEMYKSPVYKTLFVMFGPSLVAMSAAKRWHTLHQGTELVMKKQKKESAEMLLTFPPKLFSETGVGSLGAAFCAVAQVSKGKDATYTLLSFTDTTAEVSIGWTY